MIMDGNISKVVPHEMGMRYVDLPTFPQPMLWEIDGWQAESMSWKESCYIHSGISGNMFQLTGPDAQKLLSIMAMNNVYKWKDGFSKHLVFLDEKGFIRNHKLTIRDNENSYRIFGTNTPAFIQGTIQATGLDVELTIKEIFIYQISGPLSLTVIEKVTGESQRDLEFLQAKTIRIPGIDADLELSRIGMTGTLAYEIRGAVDLGLEVYNKVYEAGRPLGMKRLGWRTYTVNHTEGGYPQGGCSFVPSFMINPDWINENNEIDPMIGAMMGFRGSIEPQNYIARMRTPGQVNWMWMANFDHDFIGKEALLKEKENPKQKTVTLVWNKEDVIDVYRSLFEEGEPYRFMDFPDLACFNSGGNQDYVTTTDGKVIGMASSGRYSMYYRDIISETVIDINEAEIGKEVIVKWGNAGQRIKDIRARIERYPYLDLQDNKSYDLDVCPKGYV